jgi:membrane glycosyltransferase
VDTADARARELEEAARLAEDEPSVIELMNGPGRPSTARRRAILLVSLIFTTFMLAMTVGVISYSGFDLLTATTLALFLVAEAAMIGALLYKGEDPMEKHDSGKIPQRGRRKRRS